MSRKLVYAAAAIPFLAVRSIHRVIASPISVARAAIVDRAYQLPSDAAEPFTLSSSGSTAVILFHSWTSVPYEMRSLAQALHAEGYTVIVPRLSGHGTVPQDLEEVSPHHWCREALRVYDETAATHETIIVGGMSLGALLALHVASHRTPQGVISLSAPLVFRTLRTSVAMMRLLRSVKRYDRKHYSPLAPYPPLMRVMTYQRFPIDSALRVIDFSDTVRSNISRIAAPLCVVQSRRDHLVAPSSASVLLHHAAAPWHVQVTLDDAYHNFLTTPTHVRTVVPTIIDFVRRCARRL